MIGRCRHLSNRSFVGGEPFKRIHSAAVGVNFGQFNNVVFSGVRRSKTSRDYLQSMTVLKRMPLGNFMQINQAAIVHGITKSQIDL